MVSDSEKRAKGAGAAGVVLMGLNTNQWWVRRRRTG